MMSPETIHQGMYRKNQNTKWKKTHEKEQKKKYKLLATKREKHHS